MRNDFILTTQPPEKPIGADLQELNDAELVLAEGGGAVRGFWLGDDSTSFMGIKGE